MVLSYADIKAGVAKPFSVLHISDTHLTEAYGNESTNRQRLARWRRVTFGGRQEEALRDSIEWAREHADYLLHTGDLLDFQSQANYDIARSAFFKDGKRGSADRTGINMFAVGNHEYSPEMWLGEDKCTCDEAWRARCAPPLVNGLGRDDLSFAATVVNGVNFVMLDDVYGTVSQMQALRFREEAKKGLPIVLCVHVPFFTDDIWRAHEVFWLNKGKYSGETVFEVRGDLKRQREDPVTRDFVAYLRSERLLKGILCGHLHISVQDRFSPTAMEYVVGGNFMFHGRHVLVS